MSSGHGVRLTRTTAELAVLRARRRASRPSPTSRPRRPSSWSRKVRRTPKLVVRRVLLSPLLSGGGGAYPWFGSVFGGSGMAVGAGYLKRLEKSGSLNLLAGISINNSQLFETRVVAPALWRDRLQLERRGALDEGARGVVLRAGPRHEPGNGFRVRLPADRVQRRRRVQAAAVALVRRRLFVPRSRRPRSTTSTWRSGYAPGIGRDLQYHVTRAEATIDWRTSPGYSTRGGLYRVGVGAAPGNPRPAVLV